MTRLRLASAALALSLITAASARGQAPVDTPAQPTPQTRDFEATGLTRAGRLAIAALQDLGFALENVDAETGTLIASRLDTHPLRLTVTIAAKGETQITATVTTDYAGAQVSDPRPAEQFFSAYHSALFPAPEID